MQPFDPMMPALSAILEAAQEYSEIASRRGDEQTSKRLERVRENLTLGARLAWDEDGALLVYSFNSPGQVYRVRSSGCSCPNGAAR